MSIKPTPAKGKTVKEKTKKMKRTITIRNEGKTTKDYTDEIDRKLRAHGLHITFTCLSTLLVGVLLGFLYNTLIDSFNGNHYTLKECTATASAICLSFGAASLIAFYAKQFFYISVGLFFGIIAASMVMMAYILLRIAVEGYKFAELSGILDVINN